MLHACILTSLHMPPSKQNAFSFVAVNAGLLVDGRVQLVPYVIILVVGGFGDW